MSFNYRGLNSIGGFLGRAGLWLYDTEDVIGIITIPNYFNKAVKYGLKKGDYILISALESGAIVKVHINEDPFSVIIYSLDLWP